MTRVADGAGTRIFEGKLHLVRRGRRKVASCAPAASGPSRSRPLRVARLLALGHQIQRLVDAGETPAEVASRLGFSRARISQLMDLALLAPDIQARILGMENAGGRDAVTERELRAVLRHRAWREQQSAFRALVVGRRDVATRDSVKSGGCPPA